MKSKQADDPDGDARKGRVLEAQKLLLASRLLDKKSDEIRKKNNG